MVLVPIALALRGKRGASRQNSSDSDPKDDDVDKRVSNINNCLTEKGKNQLIAELQRQKRTAAFAQLYDGPYAVIKTEAEAMVNDAIMRVASNDNSYKKCVEIWHNAEEGEAVCAGIQVIVMSAVRFPKVTGSAPGGQLDKPAVSQGQQRTSPPGPAPR